MAEKKGLSLLVLFEDIDNEKLLSIIDEVLVKHEIQEEFKELIEKIIDNILISSGTTKSISNLRLEASSDINEAVNEMAIIDEESKTKLRNLLYAFGLKTICYLEDEGLLDSNKVFQVTDSDKHFLVIEEIKNG